MELNPRVCNVLDFVWLTTRTMHPPAGVHQPCGEPNEIDLPAVTPLMNGPLHVPYGTRAHGPTGNKNKSVCNVMYNGMYNVL